MYTVKEKKLARNRAQCLPHPDQCTTCGTMGKVQGHHTDYGDHLNVQWLCQSCHTKEHLEERRVINERVHRKWTAPCACGKKIAAKGMCKGCYMRARITADICQVPACGRTIHTRGLCNKHRQNKRFQHYKLPKIRPGTKLTFQNEN